MELPVILAIGELILKHGVPAALNIIKAWDADMEKLTPEDIQGLKEMVPPPESFFDKE